MTTYNINDMVYSEISRSICTIIYVCEIQGETHYRLQDALGRTHATTAEFIHDVTEMEK